MELIREPSSMEESKHETQEAMPGTPPIVEAGSDLIIKGASEKAIAALGTDKDQLVGQRIDAVVHSLEANCSDSRKYRNVYFAVEVPISGEAPQMKNRKEGRQPPPIPQQSDASAHSAPSRLLQKQRYYRHRKPDRTYHKILPVYTHFSIDHPDADILVVMNDGFAEALKNCKIQTKIGDSNGSALLDPSDTGRKIRVEQVSSMHRAISLLRSGKKYSLILAPLVNEFAKEVRLMNYSGAVIAIGGHRSDDSNRGARAFEMGYNGFVCHHAGKPLRTIGSILSDVAVR
ncbi:hypothetical protein [Sicyoidochytrium minutum DNA virus]|nr:hypothetical protein [Sicyoidochytrium minutum DNA virus]BDC16937.1 hypothetical protein [Sicyoidochytrium minutum DNA virus]